jgi:ABC-type Na+ efflux pump permease subunit
VKPVLLLAANFLRQRRWPVLLMFAWIVLTGLAAGGFGRDRVVAEDVAFYVQQQAIYICIFSAFMAADAINSERKARRILLVLSKAISRGEYLLGNILGTWLMAFAYALVFGVCGEWLTARAGLSASAVWSMVVLVIAASAVSSSVAMFFSTFLNPYLSAALTLVMFCAPAFLHAHRLAWSVWLPGVSLLADFLRFSFSPDWAPGWLPVIIAFLHSALFWALAAVIFDRRDIATPVE